MGGRLFNKYYMIYDNITEEYLYDYQNNFDSWDTISQKPHESALFKTKRLANSALNRIEKQFIGNGEPVDFKIVERRIGNPLYEKIREGLIDVYGSTLCDGETDHRMAEAVMNIIEEHFFG